MKKITIGCDPELFLKADGEFISVHDLLPGTKAEPFEIFGVGAIQVDGVSAEFNTRPTDNVRIFKDRIHSLIHEMSGRIYDQGYHRPKLVAEPVATFSKEYFDSLPRQVKLLGCEPDFDAYTGEQNTPPETDEPFRTGSGHIHIGWGSGLDVYPDKENPHFLDCIEIVKRLDKTLYPLTRLWDTDTQRQALYGKEGAFRPKEYGVEYRTPSNAWLKSDTTIEMVFNISKMVGENYINGIS